MDILEIKVVKKRKRKIINAWEQKIGEAALPPGFACTPESIMCGTVQSLNSPFHTDYNGQDVHLFSLPFFFFFFISWSVFLRVSMFLSRSSEFQSQDSRN